MKIGWVRVEDYINFLLVVVFYGNVCSINYGDKRTN